MSNLKEVVGINRSPPQPSTKDKEKKWQETAGKVSAYMGIGAILFGITTLAIVGAGDGPRFMGEKTDLFGFLSLIGGLGLLHFKHKILDR